MASSKLLLTASVLALAIAACAAITCYDGVVSSISTAGATKESCVSGVEVCRYWGTGSVGGKGECGTAADNNKNGTCVDETVGSLTAPTKVCYCNTDLCNDSGAGSIQVMVAVVLGCVAFAIGY